MTSAEEFTEFAAIASPRLRRTAFLLCGDWHTAEDLAQTTLAKMFVAWREIRRTLLLEVRQVDATGRLALLRPRPGARGDNPRIYRGLPLLSKVRQNAGMAGGPGRTRET